MAEPLKLYLTGRFNPALDRPELIATKWAMSAEDACDTASFLVGTDGDFFAIPVESFTVTTRTTSERTVEKIEFS